MGYPIGKAAEKSGLSIHTLRYYEKEGLLPFVERTPSGQRNFKEDDFVWLSVITCLKETGMPIKDIKEFIDWCLEGDSTLEKRLNMFQKQKEFVQAQMDALQKHLDRIDHKIWYYETAVKAGTEAIHHDQKCNVSSNCNNL